MRTKRRIGPGVTAVAIATAAALVVAACSTASTGGQSQATAAATGSASVDTTALEKVFAGIETQPPTSAPSPARGKSVWWVSCGLSIPDCSVPAESAQAAAQKLGIDFHIADGKLNVGGGDAAAVRTALAARPDALIIHGISCPIIQQPLEEAKAQGVKVMGVESLDCSDTGGPKLFTTEMNYTASAQSGKQYFEAWGKISADYVIARSGGRAVVINNEGVEPLQQAINDGFLSEVKTCGGCRIVDTVKFSSADLTPNGPWIQAFRSSLVRNPTATAVFFPFDVNIATAGGAQAIKDIGRNLISFGGSGQAPAVDLVRSGVITAITGAHSPEWMGWAAVDAINRALNNQPTVPEGVGFRVVDAQHNLPSKPGAAYQTPIDFKAAYERAWGSAG
jgi:ribose transport system substrate-binding protein